MVKKYSIGFLVLSLVLLFAACSNNDKEDTPETTADKVEITDEEKVPENDVVAVINGKDVTGKAYNLVYAQLKLHASQLGEEVDLKEVKTAAIESLIDRELLMQQAKEEGIEITDETAEAELASIKEENEDGLTTILEQYAMTEEDFKEQLKFELTLTEYKQKSVDITVTDDEIKEYYEKAKEGNEEIPALEDIKTQIKAQMEQQKSNEALQKKIDEVKKDAVIEKKMEA